MMSDLSKHEILILQAMWELKALANRAVTFQDLAGRLSDLAEMETSDGLKHLKTRGLVTTAKQAGGDLFALSPLGAACARQLLDTQLGDLSRAV